MHSHKNGEHDFHHILFIKRLILLLNLNGFSSKSECEQ